MDQQRIKRLIDLRLQSSLTAIGYTDGCSALIPTYKITEPLFTACLAHTIPWLSIRTISLPFDNRSTHAAHTDVSHHVANINQTFVVQRAARGAI